MEDLDSLLRDAFLLRSMEEKQRELLCCKLQDALRTVLAPGHAPTDVTILNPLSAVNPEDVGAVVMRARDNCTNKMVVVKDYSLDRGNYMLPDIVLEQLRLYTLLKNVAHMQQCIDVQLSASTARFVFAYYEVLFSDMMVGTKDSAFLFAQACELVRVVQYLHASLHVAHRDIKAQNICFSKRFQLVLIDFDSAVLCDKDDALCTFTEPFCTLATRAPEQVHAELSEENNVTYDAFAGDWWAVGCVIAQMYLGQELFAFQSDYVELREHFATLRTFCRELQNNWQQSRNARVVALRHCVMHKAIVPLLKGLLSLEPCERQKAVDVFRSVANV